MRRLSLLLFSLFFLCSIVQAGEMKLSGHYYGTDLVVLNPSFDGDYCVVAVKVNGAMTHDEIRSNTFSIALSLLGLQAGEAVEILILYRDGCTPEVLNPEVIVVDKNFTFDFIKLDRTNKLNWGIKGSAGKNEFIVEQFRWNNWSSVAKVAVADTQANGTYLATVYFHSGLNQFRVRLQDELGNEVYSKVAKYNNTKVAPVDLKSSKVSDLLVFSGETIYEIFDISGNMVLSGFGKEVDVTGLEKGKYYLNYDVQSVVITKR